MSMKVTKFLLPLLIAVAVSSSPAPLSSGPGPTAFLELTFANAGYCYSSGVNTVGLTIYGYNFDNGATPRVTLADFECTLRDGFPAEVDTFNGRLVWNLQASCDIPVALFPKSQIQTGIVRVTSGPKAFQADSMAVALQQNASCY
jgi:hypothetical protein